MKKYFKEFIRVTRRKGIVDTLFHGMGLVFIKLSSVIKILALRIRGYNIDFNVVLSGNNVFFQSIKSAINISSGTTLGKNTRITGGGTGKIYIRKNVLIDDSTFVMAQKKIEIGDNTAIAAFCFITDFNHGFNDKSLSVLKQGYETNPVSIGKAVWIGTHCIILPGVKIGDGAVIGAGSVVTHDIPENSLAVGNPARVIKTIKKKQ